jgi:hypothetical protein
LGAYAHYRDQDESFTGEKERRLELNLNVGFQSGWTHVDAFYRTSVHQDLYRSVLSEKDFEDPVFLLNNYDMIGASLTRRFGNGHQLSVRIQRAANSFVGTGPANKFIGLVEYSIPLGFPVSRKTTIGMLRGKVFDAENGRKGVEGVIVRANDLVTVTDMSGDYVFDGLRPGKYKLKVYDNNLPELHAFEKDTFEFELKPGSQEKVEIKVFPIIRAIQIIQQGEVTIKQS